MKIINQTINKIRE